MANHYIIYLEDNEVQKKVFGRIIKELINPEIELIITSDGQDLLEFIKTGKLSHNIKKGQVELILMDLFVSDVAEFQILEAMQKLPENKRIPIVCLSAYEESDLITKAMKLGAKDFIIKGKNKTELTRLIENIEKYCS